MLSERYLLRHYRPSPAALGWEKVTNVRFDLPPFDVLRLAATVGQLEAGPVISSHCSPSSSRIGGVYFVWGCDPMERTAVFIDYQNVHMGAYDLFTPRGEPVHQSLVHPLAVAERIAAKRSRRFPSEITQVRVFRGRPNPERQRTLTSANDAQKYAWERDARVTVHQRDLKYLGWPGQPPREKGIDVALAIDLVHTALREEYDVAVVFTSDTDILPAVELAFYETQPRIEIAAWQGAKPLWFPTELNDKRRLPFCHFLDATDFEEVRDTTKYL